ncbi:hypothetical protein RIN66_04070 [Hafnia alvei]|uniref:hypothetical protein n=1 Tax=Hafnia alvei TaxID=569 RepID=UPI0028BD7D1E|nr:hypothetical protein [Hafnia alvei]WNN53247.1 hypothetical protein RIN66_04070 [Hafnia alvei]
MPEEIKTTLYEWGKKIVAMIPYMTLLSGLVIWIYLNSLGRVDIFSDVISFNAGLVSILISMIVFAFFISVMLTMPSTILISIHSAYERNTQAESILTRLPVVCLFLSILYLLIVFIPFVPFIYRHTGGYELGVPFICMIILALSFSFVFLTLMCNFKWDKNHSIINGIFTFLFHTVINTVLTCFTALSISIPISFLMQSSKGENTLAIIFALVFMTIFAVFSFFPAIVYFNSSEVKSTKLNIISLARQLLLTILMTVFSISLFFPNLPTMFIYSSLSAIGIVSKTPHFYLVNGEKYKPAMFYKESWNTRVLPDIGDNFYIKGVNVFSVDDKNLICPEEVVKIKNDTEKRDYASFIPLADKHNVARLKEVTKDCLVLLDDDIHQWDTLFDNKGEVKQ